MRRGEYTISTENKRLDIRRIHDFVSNQSYWGTRPRDRDCAARSRQFFKLRALQNNHLIGFARVVTDYATFAWIADVFVLRNTAVKVSVNG